LRTRAGAARIYRASTVAMLSGRCLVLVRGCAGCGHVQVLAARQLAEALKKQRAEKEAKAKTEAEEEAAKKMEEEAALLYGRPEFRESKYFLR
jgi:hypothetical protein